MNSPSALLITTGLLLGLTFPLGKLAGEAAIPPLMWAMALSAGSALCLITIRVFQGKGIRTGGVYPRYYLLSATVSLVIPNALIFLVVSQLGAGYTSVFFTLSPVFTLLLSSILQVRVPSRLGVLGVLTGLAGALMVAFTRGEAAAPAAWIWVFLGLCIPISLAIGNVYRSVAWPKDGEPLELAAGSNVAAAAMLLIATLAVDGTGAFRSLLNAPWLTLAQVVASTAMFTTLFRLQLAGGPTYLSQIGYVAAAVALLAGTVFMGERYALLTWVGSGVIFAGVGLSILAARRQG